MSSDQVQEELKTLVSGLKTAREVKGLSLKDVHEKTRISVTILDALEKGEFHLLPPDVYTRNFIHSYADFLEVDCEPILAYFKEESERTAAPPVLQKENATAFPFPARHWKYSAAGLLIFFLIAILAWFFYSYVNKSLLSPAGDSGEKKSAQSREETSAAANRAFKDVANLPAAVKPFPVTPDSVPPRMTEPGPVQSPPVPENRGNAGPYTLIIEAKEKTWLRIRTDHGETTERMMQPGERMDLSARERFTLDIGNAAGVRVLFQDRLLENLGEQGQVVHLRLP